MVDLPRLGWLGESWIMESTAAMILVKCLEQKLKAAVFRQRGKREANSDPIARRIAGNAQRINAEFCSCEFHADRTCE
jgi:hypothetical protein